MESTTQAEDVDRPHRVEATRFDGASPRRGLRGGGSARDQMRRYYYLFNLTFEYSILDCILGLEMWIDGLSDEDLAFIRRFVLASGSLKELAEGYGISYPTVRLRLDRLIEKIRVLEDHEIASDFERTLRALHAEGRIAPDAFRRLLDAYENEKENGDEARARPPKPVRGR